jgi:hypothetical protein
MQRSLVLLFFLVATSTYSQLNTKIMLEGEQYELRLFKDTLELSSYITKIQNQFIAKGYFFTGLDSVHSRDGKVLIYLYRGSKLDSKIVIDGKERKNPSKLITKTVIEYANNGFPFVQVALDSLSIEEKTLSGKLEIYEGPQITYDTAFFFSSIKTNKSYIYQLLDIEPDDLFSEANYQTISKKVERSPFLEIKRPTDISFIKTTARIFLDLKENESNTFQGVLGLQQGNNNRTIAVGSLDLNIENLFSSGKQLDFSWERYSENSQRLNIFYKHPFFLDSKVSPSFLFDLLKQDTVFLTRNTGLGINTFVSPTINLALQFQKSTGTLLTGSASVASFQGLADYEKSTYKLELSSGYFEKLGTLKEDIVWKINVGAGKKHILKNLNFQDSFYDSLQLETNFFQAGADIAYQIRVRKRQTFYHHISTSLLQNRELLANELYRLGGLSTVRGFNEKYFFANQYIISRSEFRTFFEDYSYLYVFYDQLFYQHRENNEFPFGFGFGFALATSSGQFSFVLAAGKSNNQEIDFTGIKAHFGYISRF